MLWRWDVTADRNRAAYQHRIGDESLWAGHSIHKALGNIRDYCADTCHSNRTFVEPKNDILGVSTMGRTWGERQATAVTRRMPRQLLAAQPNPQPPS